jgi:asparagine synthase (glutamine-hydrolysing)
MTMSTGEAGGDERRYARALTSALGLPLIENHHRLDDVDIETSSSAHLPRPNGYAFGQSQDRVRLDIAAETGADAYFTGQGGDNVFCLMQSATPLLDRFRSEGMGVGLLETARDISLLTGCSWWDAIGAAYTRSKRPARYIWGGSPYLMNTETVDAAAILLTHPWLDAPVGALPGKAVHISMLLRIQMTRQDLSRRHTAPLISPLLSQPIVEFCLGVPSWRWCAGGQNRSPVREAFTGMLPGLILQRRTKGGPDAFCAQVVEANRHELRDILRSGHLARRSIIDLTAVERALSPDRPIQSPDHVRISEIGETEAWLKVWTERSTKAKGFRFLNLAGGGPARGTPDRALSG